MANRRNAIYNDPKLRRNYENQKKKEEEKEKKKQQAKQRQKTAVSNDVKLQRNQTNSNKTTTPNKSGSSAYTSRSKDMLAQREQKKLQQARIAQKNNPSQVTKEQRKILKESEVGKAGDVARATAKQVGGSLGKFFTDFGKSYVDNSRLPETPGRKGKIKQASDKSIDKSEKWLSNMYNKAVGLQEKGEKEYQRAIDSTDNKLERGAYKLENLALNMAPSIAIGGPLGLAEMGIQAAGSELGKARKNGATEAEDRLRAYLLGGVEAGTEMLGGGIGPARRLLGKDGKAVIDLSGRVADKVAGKFTTQFGKTVAPQVAKWLVGIGEENLEEIAAWAVDPLVSNAVYGNKAQKRKELGEQEYLNDLTSNFKDNFYKLGKGNADAVISKLNSEDFVNQVANRYMEEGASKEDALQMADIVRNYIAYELAGDTKNAQKLQNELVKVATGINPSKESWSLDELKETLALTTAYTGIFGAPSAVMSGKNISQAGKEIKSQLSDSGINELLNYAMNSEDEQISIRSQSMKDFVQSGKGELSDYQVGELSNALNQQYEKDAQRQNASNQAAQKLIKEDGSISPVSYNRNGDIEYIGKKTAEIKAENDNNVAKVIEDNKVLESLPEEKSNAIGQAVSNYMTGVLTVGDANELTATNVEARQVFELATGEKLPIVLDKTGNIDIVKTNTATKEYLFQNSAKNLANTAKAETANFYNEQKPVLDKDVMSRLGASGQSAYMDITSKLDIRNTPNYMINADAIATYYSAGRNSSFENFAELQRTVGDNPVFAGVSLDARKQAFNAGLEDKYLAQTKAGAVVKQGETKADTSYKGKGEIYIETENIKNDDVELFNSLAKGLNVNIHIVDNLPTSNGGQANGIYKDGEIWLNVNETTDRNIGYVFMHEVTHYIKDNAPEQFNELEQMVRNAWFEFDNNGMQQAIKQKIDLYKANGQTLTEAEAMEEIIADATYEMLQDEEFANQVSDENPSLARAILDGIRSALRKLREMFAMKGGFTPRYNAGLLSTLDILKEAEQLWLNALHTAAKNSADGFIAENNGENRFSLPEGYDVEDIEDEAEFHIEDLIEENDLDISLVSNAKLYGSRMRGDNRSDSDIDIVIEYKGDMKEYELFNILNEEPFAIGGIEVDINPIRAEESGTIDEYMARARAYNPDDRYSIVEDSQGRELSQGQKEFYANVDSHLLDENGRLKRYYHGTARADRVGNIFDPDRATSGPMAFFTDNKEIAEHYSKDKQDTSLAYDTSYDDYSQQFRTGYSEEDGGISIDKAWSMLSKEDREHITTNAHKVHLDDDYENIIYDEDNKDGIGGLGGQIEDYKGNTLRALVYNWLDGGTLFNQEERFLDVLELIGVNDVLKKAGLTEVKYFNPRYREESVYEEYLNITNPFLTSEIDNEDVDDMVDWLDATDLSMFEKETADADLWDKNNRSIDEWIEYLREDVSKGTTLAWTSIPDAITAYLKDMGYDGIVDEGGKHGGQKHQVVIPFYSEQIKNIDNENPTENPDIRYSLPYINEDATKETTNNLRQQGVGMIHNREELRTFVDKSLSDKEYKAMSAVAIISNDTKEKITTDLGKNIFKDNQYTLQINSDYIRHISKHFDNNMEKICDEVERLSDVVSNYDNIMFSKKHGQNRIVFEKSFEDVNVRNIDAVSNKKNALQLVSIFYTKKRSQVLPLAVSNVATRWDSASLYENSILRENKKVKFSIPDAEVERVKSKKRHSKADALLLRSAGEKLSKADFDKIYDAHKLGLRKGANAEEDLAGIMENGFAGDGGFGVNTMPATINDGIRYIDEDTLRKQGFRTDEEIAELGLTPSGFNDDEIESMKNGKFKVENGGYVWRDNGIYFPVNTPQMKYGSRKGDVVILVPSDQIENNSKVKNGYKPLPYEVLRVERNYQPYYELYSKAYDEYQKTRFSIPEDIKGRKLSPEQQKFFAGVNPELLTEDGRLKVFYHYTDDGGFSVFDPGKSDDNRTIFFTDDWTVGTTYSSADDDELVNFTTEELGSEKYGNNKNEFWKAVSRASGRYEVYLNLKNPLVVEADGSEWSMVIPLGDEHYEFDIDESGTKPELNYRKAEKSSNWYNTSWEEREYKSFDDMDSLLDYVEKTFGSDLSEELKKNKYYDGIVGADGKLRDLPQQDNEQNTGATTESTRSIAKRAYKDGYDGVIFKNLVDIGGESENPFAWDSTVVAVFNSENIKLVDNTAPTSNPDIRYSIPTETELQQARDNLFKYENEVKTLRNYVKTLQDRKNTEGVSDEEKQKIDEDVYRAELMIAKNETLADTQREALNQVTQNYNIPTEDDIIESMADSIEEYDANAEMPYENRLLEESRQRRINIMDEVKAYGEKKHKDTVLTHDLVLNEKSVNAACLEFVKSIMQNSEYVNTQGRTAQYSTKVLNFVKDAEKKMFTEYKAGKYDELWNTAFDTAAELVESIDIVDDERFGLYKEFRDYWRANPIYVPESLKNDFSKGYGVFYRNNLNRLILTNNPANPTIDMVWDDAVEKFGGLLEIDLEHPADMLEDISNTMDSLEDYKVAYESEETYAVVKSTAEDLLDICMDQGEAWHSFADRKKAQYDMQTKRLKERHKEAMRAVREKQKEKIQEVKEYYKEREQKAKEKGERKEINRKLGNELNWLSNALLKPTDNIHIPHGYDSAVAQLLASIDRQSERSKQLEKKYGVSGATMQLLKLKSAYKKIAEADDTGMIIDDDLLILMEELGSKVDNRPLYELTNSEIEDVYQIVRTITHTLRNMNTMVAESYKENLGGTVDKIIKRVDDIIKVKKSKYGKKFDRANNKFILNSMAKPGWMFEWLGGGLQDAYMGIRLGMDQEVNDLKYLQESYIGIFNKYFNRKKPGSDIEKWRNGKETIDFTLENGEQISITPAQAMSLYATSLREAAWEHMYKGGVCFTKNTISKDAKNRIGERVHISTNDVANITAELSEDQKNIADALLNLLHGTPTQWANEVSLKLYGYEKYTEENYYPMTVLSDWLNTDISHRDGVPARLKNPSFSKALVEHANNPLVIDDMFSVVTGHLASVLLYHSYAIPVNDFLRVYNYKYVDENGDKVAVKELIRKAFGDEAITYINHFLNDVNGMNNNRKDGLTQVLDMGLSAFKRSRVGSNMRVVLQQPMAVARAWMYISPKYFVKIPFTQIKQNYKEMTEHCPITWWKAQNHSDINMGHSLDEMMMNRSWSKYDYITFGLAAGADNITWAWIWSAVKKEVKANNPNVEYGSQEFWNLCNERASYIFDQTQVVDSVMHRSDVMRNKDNMTKTLTSFMAEPTTTENMLVFSYMKSLEQAANGDKVKAFNTCRKAVMVYAINAVMVGLGSALWDVVRDAAGDDDDKEKFLEHWWENFLDNLNPLNLLPLLKDTVSAWQGWDVENLSEKAFTDIAKSVRGFFDEPSFENAFDSAQSIAVMFGLPVKTVIKDFKALSTILFGSYAAEIGSELLGGFWNKAGVKDGSGFDKFLNFFGMNLTDAEKAERDYQSRLSEIQDKIKGLSGEEKDDKIWSMASDGYTKAVEEGELDAIRNIRRMVMELGGNMEEVDKRILDKMKTAYRKTIGVPGKESMQYEYREFMQGTLGVTDAELSRDIVYSSEMGKKFKAACKIQDVDMAVEALTYLYDAGIRDADVDRLWQYRNSGDVSKYLPQGSTGTYIWPVDGTISSEYGYRNAPTAGASSNHQGIDIAARSGTNVGASDGGEVIYADYDGGYGYTVGIKHKDGTITQYSHLKQMEVYVGDTVTKSQTIGKVGSTGTSTGPHLHFAVLNKNGEYVNPMKYLK